MIGDCTQIAGANLGLVFFAGHGTETGGRNYLIPDDATLAAGAIDLEAIALDTVLRQLDGVTQTKLVILDACRHNLFAPAGAKRAVGRGLARIEPEDNTLVVYAAKDGTTADDGLAGTARSLQALLKHIAAPGLEINLLFRRVRDDVMAATGRRPGALPLRPAWRRPRSTSTRSRQPGPRRSQAAAPAPRARPNWCGQK